MKTVLGNLLRWIVFVPVIVAAMMLIQLGFNLIAGFFGSLRPIWFIILAVIGGAFIFRNFQYITIGIVASVLRIPPHKKVGGIIFGITAIIFGLYGTYQYWTFDFISIFAKIVLSLLFLGFWIVLVIIGFTLDEY